MATEVSAADGDAVSLVLSPAVSLSPKHDDAPMRADRSTSRVGRIWLDLEPRRETLFLINIGVPILIGV
jgi:hypothetical protein